MRSDSLRAATIALCLALLVSSMTVGSVLVSPPSPAEAAVPTALSAVLDQHEAALAPCADVLYVAVRGSGESPTEFGGMGRMNATVRDGLAASLPASVTVKQVALEYPAYAILPTGNGSPSLVDDMKLLRDQVLYNQPVTQPLYFFSVQLGVAQLLTLVSEEQNRCGDAQKIVLAGYSSGAWVVHIALGVMGDGAPVDAVSLIADPMRGADSGQAESQFVGTPKDTSGVAAALVPFVPAGLFPAQSTATIPPAVRARTIETCGATDPVCDASDGPINDPVAIGTLIDRLMNTMSVHSDYGTAAGAASATALTEVGGHLAGWLAFGGSANLRLSAVASTIGAVSETSAFTEYGGTTYFSGAVNHEVRLLRMSSAGVPEAVGAGLFVPTALTVFAGSLYFSAVTQNLLPSPSNQIGMYRITGSAEPVLVAANSQPIAAAADVMYFMTSSTSIMRMTVDGTITSVGGGAWQSWNYSAGDATVFAGDLYLAGTRRYAEGGLYRVTADAAPTLVGNINPRTMQAFGGRLYVLLGTTGGQKLARLDDTGTLTQVSLGDATASSLFTYDGHLYINAATGGRSAVFKTTGEDTPWEVITLGELNPVNTVAFGGLLYFTSFVEEAGIGTYGILYRYNGLSAPTPVLTTTGVRLRNAVAIAPMSGNLMILGADSGWVNNLYTVTGAGLATRVATLGTAAYPVFSEGGGGWFGTQDGRLLFPANSGTTGSKFWEAAPFTPSITITGGTTAHTTVTAPTLSGTTNTANTTEVVVTVDGHRLTTTTDTGTWQVVSAPLAVGPHLVSAVVTEDGRTSPAATQTLTITAPPSAPPTDPPTPMPTTTPTVAPTVPPVVPPPARLEGSNRYETSAVISAASFAPGVAVVYIAVGTGFADALSGAPAAGDRGGPVLLVQSDAIPDAVKTELRRLAPREIVILGGTTVISTAVESQLRTYTTGAVSRLAGADRYETSATISAHSFPVGVPVAYVAVGTGFADALSGAPAAGKNGSPVLLVQQGAIPGPILTELQRLHPGRIVVLGGTGAISATVESQLRSLTSGGVTRLAGEDRYQTSAMISAASYLPGVNVAYIAIGTGFADALSGAAVAGRDGGPVLLAQANGIPAAVHDELVRLKPQHIVVLGGTTAISSAVEAQLAALTAPRP